MRILLLLGILALGAWADSPLTSTDFWRAYRELPQVKEAHDIERLNTRLANFLLDAKKPIDQKAAVINALSWNFYGRQNAMLFREVLAQKYKCNPEVVEPRLSSSELFCLAYLTALDDYFNVKPALKLSAQARKRNPTSYTVAIVDGLIRSQTKMEWAPIAAVIGDRNLKMDLRPKANQIILNYMKLYRPK